MGYTHYFEKPNKPLNSKAFGEFIETAQKIVHACSPTGPIGGVYYEGEEVKIAGPNGDKEPLFTGTEIALNGEGENAHESLNIRNIEDGLGTFNFCKTARKPYDIVVTGILIALKKKFEFTVKINSDGDIDEWEPGLNLYNTCVEDKFKVKKETLEKWIKQ